MPTTPSSLSQHPKRRPTVLVTDARDTQTARPRRARSPPQRYTDNPSANDGESSSSPHRFQPGHDRTESSPSMVRFVSVDQVLRGSSEVPSGQARLNPLAHLHRARHPLPPPVNPRRVVDQSRALPVRSSKLSEKLVILPELEEEDPGWDYQVEDEEGPLRDDEEELLQHQHEIEEEPAPESRYPRRKSYAERLSKIRRAEKFPRVTAYCTAGAYRLTPMSNFLRELHGARAKLYNECLYVAYHLPLLPGHDGYRIKSSPALKNPGGKPVLDVEIERSEQQNYHEGYFEVYRGRRYSHDEEEHSGPEGGLHESPHSEEGHHTPESQDDGERHHNGHAHPGSQPQDADGSRVDMKAVAEMFVFSYGVVVFWNFTERQEKELLADMTFACERQGIELISGPMAEEEFETEEFHFEYSEKTRSPRIYNDMITLRSGDIMIKLAISHAIAQSTKLCRFEERMNITMAGVEHVPKKLALTGTLGMKREDVIKMSGRLFRLRVDVNLSSNVLDVPEFFWDEPSLHPLYSAVREYLEIQPRVGVLNSRCRVFLDLAEILTDSIADSNMSRITWIIIVLIMLSITVTVAEVMIRFGILSEQKGGSKASRALEL